MKHYLNMSEMWDEADAVFAYAGNRTGSRVHKFNGTEQELDVILGVHGWKRDGGYSIRKGDPSWDGEDWSFTTIKRNAANNTKATI